MGSVVAAGAAPVEVSMRFGETGSHASAWGTPFRARDASLA